jgi:hypothetical protein
MDLKRMSFPLTHPAFFRVIGFDWQGKSPAAKYRGYGRGQPLKYSITKDQEKDFTKQVFGDNAVYIAGSRIIDQDEKYIKEALIS